MGDSLQENAILKIGNLIKSYSFKFVTEKDLQDGFEKVFQDNGIPYNREYQLNKKDILDFYVIIDGVRVAVELKIKGTRNNTMRQISRYLLCSDVDCAFLMGTPYWICDMPRLLLGKKIYCHRILTAFS